MRAGIAHFHRRMANLDGILKSRDITLLTKVHLAKSMVFPAVMRGCESWTIKKAKNRRIDAFKLWCWRRYLDCKEIQPVHPKGDQSWIFIGRTDAEAETPILWPPDVKNLPKNPPRYSDFTVLTIQRCMIYLLMLYKYSQYNCDTKAVKLF